MLQFAGTGGGSDLQSVAGVGGSAVTVCDFFQHVIKISAELTKLFTSEGRSTKKVVFFHSDPTNNLRELGDGPGHRTLQSGGQEVDNQQAQAGDERSQLQGSESALLEAVQVCIQRERTQSTGHHDNRRSNSHTHLLRR